MTKKPDPFRFNNMTKAELIKTVKTLHARQTLLLNRCAKLERELSTRRLIASLEPTPAQQTWPWERTDKYLPNPFGEK